MKFKEYNIREKQKIYQREDGSIAVETVFDAEDESVTQQQFKDDCDINNIMKKYTQTGEFSHLNPNKGQYLDLVGLPDYQTALHTVIQAEESFMTVPAEIRKKFDNDPSQFIKFLSDEKNNDEAVKLGLKVAQQTPIDYQKEIYTEIKKQNLNPKPKQNKPKQQDLNFDSQDDN
ncbi:MAG: internal scaffolding protein [Microviridae sp.]|nr:MAG: internal scaffolding protein [Microviridae sp.]